MIFQSILKYKITVLCALIILTGLFLRFYRINELFYYAIDEEKASYIIQGIATAQHFPTLGFPSSIGFRLPPIFYYAMAPFYKFFLPLPITIAYLSITVSFISMILIYHLGKRINVITGIIALIIYCFSYLNIIYEQRGWQLSFESFFILIIIHSLIKLKNCYGKFIFPLTLSMIVLTQLEVGLFTLVPFVLIMLYLIRPKIEKSYMAICILLIISTNLGYLIFDLRHNFLNSKYLLNYFNNNASERVQLNKPLTGNREVYFAHNLIIHTLSRSLIPSGKNNLAIQYANCPQYLAQKQKESHPWVLLTVTGIIIYGYYRVIMNKQKRDNGNFLVRTIMLYLTIHFSAIALYTYVFHGEMAEYYLIPTLVFFYLLTAIALEKLLNGRFKFIITVLCIGAVVINIYKLINKYNPYGLSQKIEAVNYSLSVVKNHPFKLSSFQTCWYSGGYRYLYTFFGKEPATSYMDEYLSEYYKPNLTIKPEYNITILTPELIGSNPPDFDEFRKILIETSSFKKKFGEIEIYISKI